jgi:hypothetical protein
MFYELAYLGNILDEGDKEFEVGEEVEQGEHAVFHHQQQDHCKSVTIEDDFQILLLQRQLGKRSAGGKRLQMYGIFFGKSTRIFVILIEKKRHIRYLFHLP